jgi:hypothetical protein
MPRWLSLQSKNAVQKEKMVVLTASFVSMVELMIVPIEKNRQDECIVLCVLLVQCLVRMLLATFRTNGVLIIPEFPSNFSTEKSNDDVYGSERSVVFVYQRERAHHRGQQQQLVRRLSRRHSGRPRPRMRPRSRPKSTGAFPAVVICADVATKRKSEERNRPPGQDKLDVVVVVVVVLVVVDVVVDVVDVVVVVVDVVVVGAITMRLRQY